MGSRGESSPPHPISIAILGGGISGLVLWIALSKLPHFSFRIYESVPEYRDVGAGLAVHLNGIKAMSLVGEEVRQKYFAKALNMGEEDLEMATQVILAHGPNSGEVVAELGRAKGRKTIQRHALMMGYAELLPEENIVFGKRAERIEEPVQEDGRYRVFFQDGTHVKADVVIGADGVHSITRAYILGRDHPAVGAKNHEGYQNYRRTMPMAKAREYGMNPRWESFVPIFCGPRGNLNSMPLKRGELLSVGMAVRGLRFEADQYGGAPELDPTTFGDYSDEAQLMIRMIADDMNQSWSYADHDHAPVYYRRRVCMIGDAAHTMHPFAGNGAAQALEDCAVLGHLFSKVTSLDQVDKAFQAYDQVRRPRSQAVVDISRRFGRIYGYADKEIGTDPEKMKAFFKDAAAFTNNVDLEQQNETAMRAYESLV